jgi:hypothetical protein
LSDDAKVYLLASVQKYKNRELNFRALLAQDRTQLLELIRA